MAYQALGGWDRVIKPKTVGEKYFAEQGYSSGLFLWWKVFFLDRRDDNVIWIHHLCEMNLADFGQQLVGVDFAETVIRMNPRHQFGKRDAQRIIDRPID